MAKRQFELSQEEIEGLRQAESQTRDVHELKRLQGTRLYGSGERLGTIKDMVGCGESTVRQWAMKYRAAGLAGLRSQWQGGNANKLSAEQRALVKERLHDYRPMDLGLSASPYWSVGTLQVALQQWFGITYQDEDSYHHLLRRSGFSYQRSAKIYRSQPSAAVLSDFEAELEKK